MRLGAFQHHVPTDEQLPRIRTVRAAFEALEAVLRENVQGNRERSVAFTNIEQACMWAIKGIVLENAAEER